MLNNYPIEIFLFYMIYISKGSYLKSCFFGSNLTMFTFEFYLFVFVGRGLN